MDSEDWLKAQPKNVQTMVKLISEGMQEEYKLSLKSMYDLYTIGLVNAEERGRREGAVKLYESIKSKFTKAGLTEKEMNESDFRRGQNSILENMESELRRKGWII